MAKSDQGKKKPRTSGPMIDDDSVWVLGTHMTKFGRYPNQDAVDLASTSAIAALEDGGVTIHDMDVFAAGTLFQASSGMAQQVQKQIGQTGIPAYNVSNACSTGSNALILARQFVEGGLNECALAVGVEKMAPGPLGGAHEPLPLGRLARRQVVVLRRQARRRPHTGRRASRRAQNQMPTRQHTVRGRTHERRGAARTDVDLLLLVVVRQHRPAVDTYPPPSGTRVQASGRDPSSVVRVPHFSVAYECSYSRPTSKQSTCQNDPSSAASLHHICRSQ